MVNVIIEPYEPLIYKAILLIEAKLPHYFDGISKIVLEPGQSGHFGKVHSDDKETIYVSLQDIRTALSGVAEEDIIQQVAEVLAHEMGHIKSDFQGGETPANQEEESVRNQLAAKYKRKLVKKSWDGWQSKIRNWFEKRKDLPEEYYGIVDDLIALRIPQHVDVFVEEYQDVLPVIFYLKADKEDYEVDPHVDREGEAALTWYSETTLEFSIGKNGWNLSYHSQLERSSIWSSTRNSDLDPIDIIEEFLPRIEPTPENARRFPFNSENTLANLKSSMRAARYAKKVNAVIQLESTPAELSDSILRIIYHFAQKVNPENQRQYLEHVSERMRGLAPSEIAQKEKNPGGGIGAAVSLSKNILAGQSLETISATLALLQNRITQL